MQMILSPEHYATLRALYATSVERKQELTLMGGAEIHDRQVRLTMLVMPKQEGSAAYTELVGTPTWMDEIAGLAPVWIHTHPGMSAFWSLTDQECLDAFAPPPMVNVPFSWGMAIVLGRDQWLARFSMWQPLALVVEPVAITMDPDPGPLAHAMTWIKDQVAHQVKWSIWDHAKRKGGQTKWERMWRDYQ